MFNPYALSNHRPSPAAVYRRHEMEKRRSYEQRVREIEHSSFTPLLFSAVGGMGAAASVFYKRLASLLAEKQAQTYAKTIGCLRCTLSFSLMRLHSCAFAEHVRLGSSLVDQSPLTPRLSWQQLRAEPSALDLIMFDFKIHCTFQRF